MKVTKESDMLNDLFGSEHEVTISEEGKKYKFKIRSLSMKDYMEVFNEKQKIDEVKVIERGLIEPKMSKEQIMKLKSGIALILFNAIMEKSFLAKREGEN